MMSFITPHLPLLDLIFIGTGYALSQAIVFRAGTFSVATSGFAALGAYAAAILTVKHGLHPAVAVGLGTLLGYCAGCCCRLRWRGCAVCTRPSLRWRSSKYSSH